MISPRQYRQIARQWRSQIVAHPTVEPCSQQDYTDYKRVNVTEKASVIEDKLQAAREEVERYLGFALVYQIWDHFMELPPGTFPYFGMTASIFARYFGYQPEGVEIPYPPLIQTIGVYTSDESGAETLVDPSIYWVSRENMPGRIAQKIDASWQDTSGRAFETFRVRCSSGYLLPFTATPNAPDISVPGHNFTAGSAGANDPSGQFVSQSIIQLTNRDGALPAGLVQNVNYYVVSAVAGVSIQIALTPTGTAIAPTDAGSSIQFVGVLPSQIRRAILETAAYDRFGAKGSKGSSGGQTEAIPPRAKDFLNQLRMINI